MKEKASRKLITDAHWQELEEAIKQAKHSLAGAPPNQNEREFLEAVLWIARTGSPWRDLPPQQGYWHAVYMRFRRWEARGVWKKLWTTLQAREFSNARHLFIDSTTVRAHQHAAGAAKKKAHNRLLAALVGD